MFGNKKELKNLQKIVDAIVAQREKMHQLSDEALKNKTEEFRCRLKNGETLDDLLVEAYAVVREAGRRVLGMEHFPAQMMGGIVLHQGGIAQMCTGEGKTLVSTLPAYLNALNGEGVHVVTVNDYLAKRDSGQMGQIHEFLGLSVGAVLGGMDVAQRKAAYQCDITYVTNSELGFDYLRDNMATDKSQIVQRGFHFAIIDEVDSVLIDEARTPLIISRESTGSTRIYEACDALARCMTRGEDLKELTKLDLISGVVQEETGDFIVIEKENRVILTEEGIRRVERFFRIENIGDIENIEIQRHMNLALRANNLMVRDRDYVVKDGEVFIVDGLTGRIMPGRKYSEGLHQAIEAKEQVKIHQENCTVATVTYQNFFNKYQKKSGMTGTGRTEEEEFWDIYGLKIIEIPTNRPILRIDREDVIFRTKEEKMNAVCEDVVESLKEKRPVLVGTVSVSDSEELSRMFTEKGIRHNVLNAKYHEKEAAIVADAGRSGAVTVATNMAGRGTDIKLDQDALKAGGLLVIGTERFESRRIDDQLCGRAGRQGDPGESRFYLSLDDNLLRLFNQKRMKTLFDAHKLGEGVGITHATLTKAVRQAQRRVEGEHSFQRRQLLEYDQVLNEQREIVYDRRLKVLEEQDIHGMLAGLLRSAVEDAVKAAEEAETPIEQRTMVLDTFAEVLSPPERAKCETCEEKVFSTILADALIERYTAIENGFDDKGFMQERERLLLLENVDRHWMEHIGNLEQLRQGIGLVAYAQKDPVKEYQEVAYYLFEQMNSQIRYDTAMAILSIRKVRG